MAYRLPGTVNVGDRSEFLPQKGGPNFAYLDFGDLRRNGPPARRASWPSGSGNSRPGEQGGGLEAPRIMVPAARRRFAKIRAPDDEFLKDFVLKLPPDGDILGWEDSRFFALLFLHFFLKSAQRNIVVDHTLRIFDDRAIFLTFVLS